MGDLSWSNAFLHFSIYLGLTILSLAAMHLLMPYQNEPMPHQRRLVFIVVITWLACSVALMFASPAGESHDIFDYLFRGRMMTEYQANPLVDVPQTLGLSIPYARYLAWRKNVDTYGPAWEAFSALVAYTVRQAATWLGWWDPSYPVCPKSPESCRLLIVYIAGYRLLAVSMVGLSGCLIASIVRRSQPAFVPLVLVVWLWSPLTLITAALGGHNDAVMIVLILLCLWLLQRQHPFLAVMALLLAAHIKLTALIWLPACALWIVWRQGWKQALKIGLASILCGLMLSWVLYAPFGGWQTLPRMLRERSAYLANSPWQIVKYGLVKLAGMSSARAVQFSVRLSTWLFAVGAFLIPIWMFNFCPRCWRRPPVTSQEADQILWRSLVATGLLYLLVGSFWFQHWYILWLLAPAALLPKSLFTRSVIPWLVFGALVSNGIMSYFLAPQSETVKLLLPVGNHSLTVGMIWIPALLASLFLWFSTRKSHMYKPDGI